MKRLPLDTKEITALEAFRYAASRSVDRDQHINFRGSDATEIVFTDGSSIIAQSEYEGPYSDVTPDCNIMPPTFYLKQKCEEA